jgi:hypothetical protein
MISVMLLKNKIFRIATFLLFVAANAQALVHLYERDTCLNLWRRRPMGFRNTWNEGTPAPVDSAFEESGFNVEVTQAIEFVYTTYEKVLRAAGRKDDFIREFIQKCRQEDQHLNKEGIRYFYFVFRNRVTSEIEGVVRFIVIKKGERGQLPCLVGTPFESANGNRSEVGRLVAHSKPGETHVPKELAYAGAYYLKGFFPENDYVLYGATDAGRTRLYRTEYNMNVKSRINTPANPNSHLLDIEGTKFHDIYIEHVQTAYLKALRQHDYDGALALIYDYQEKYHLSDYGPSLNAATHIRLLRSVQTNGWVSSLAWQVGSRHADKSVENRDWEAIFLMRATYDIHTGRGDPYQGYQILMNYLETEPLDQALDPRRAIVLSFYRELYRMHMGYCEEMRRYRNNVIKQQVTTDTEQFETLLLSLTDLNEISLLEAVNKTLEPSTGGFLTITNPYLFRLKGLIHQRRHEAALAQEFLRISRGLVEPELLESFEQYWKTPPTLSAFQTR